MKSVLMKELKNSEDPLVVGPDKEIFDSYVRYSPIWEFPYPGIVSDAKWDFDILFS